MVPPPQAPESWRSTPVSLPFPIDDAPVGIVDASLRITQNAPGSHRWDRGGNAPAIIYPTITHTAEYTIRFDGDEPEIIRIAVPALGVPDRWIGFRDGIGDISEIEITVDGEPAEPVIYLPQLYESYTAPGEEGDLSALLDASISDLIHELQAQANHVFRNFDPDEPATLYMIARRGPHGPGIYFNYDPQGTTLLVDTKFNISPRHFRGNRIEFRNPAQVLVIGDSPLSWQDFDNTDENYLYIAKTETVTPREFLLRVQNQYSDSLDHFHYSDFLDLFYYTVGPDDFFLIWADRLVDEQDGPPGFADIHYPPRIFGSQSLVVSIPFEPGEERVLSITYDPHLGMRWNQDRMQSIYYLPILTQPAEYWDFFDSFSISVQHPGNAAEVIFSQGFEMQGSTSTLSLNHAPGENLYMGFWMPDERRGQSGGGGGFFLIVIIGLIFYLLAGALPYLLIIGSIVYVIVLLARKPKSSEKDEHK